MEFMIPFRKRIDDLDDQIIELLAQRFDVIREVAHAKHERGVPSVIPERVMQVRERNAKHAEQKNIDPELIRAIYTRIIQASCDLEDVMMSAMDDPGTE
ncbi:chorismate mutase [Kiloniella sp. b19]|uniref:chorismate mutase n=1 Tax=Kiloniella sp. GXU_MW_B19 TaxID=3141326 RepID=UPI0031D64A4B